MRHISKIRLIQLIILLSSLFLWQLSTNNAWIDPFFFSSPSGIASRVWDWFTSGEIYRHLYITLLETILSFIFGTLIGVGLGVWLGLSPTASEVLDPFIKILNAIPRILFAPIFVMWFGLGISSKVALGVTIVFFLAFFNTYQGVREVNPVVLANARLLRARKSALLRHVYLPSAATWILSSLRASVGFAVMGAVVAEYLGSSSGLGHLIAQAEGVFDATGVFSGILVLSLFVIVLDRGVDFIENHVMAWKKATN